MTYTHTSKASLKMYPTSSFTAAVQDVENGLVDMALGPFWITGQRLKMTTFTVPLGEFHQMSFVCGVDGGRGVKGDLIIFVAIFH